MVKSIQDNKRWRTWRKNVTVDDVSLTNYEPGDLDATVRSKMIGVHPATAIAIMAVGRDTANQFGAYILSGWMDLSSDSGPGLRLAAGAFTLGSKSSGVDKTLIPGWTLDSGDEWLHIDTWTDTAGLGVPTFLNTTDRESLFLLPTYGCTHLLLELSLNTVVELSVAWRPAVVGEVMETF